MASAVLLPCAQSRALRKRYSSSYWEKLLWKERYASRSACGKGKERKPERIVGARPVTSTRKTKAKPITPRQKRALRGTRSKARSVFFWSKRCHTASGKAPQQWRMISNADWRVRRPDSARKWSQCQISAYHSLYQ